MIEILKAKIVKQIVKHTLRKILRYQIGNQKPSIDECHTMQLMARRISVQDIYNILCQTLKKTKHYHSSF